MHRKAGFKVYYKRIKAIVNIMMGINIIQDSSFSIMTKFNIAVAFVIYLLLHIEISLPLFEEKTLLRIKY
jgi:hypothetical protein